MLTGECPIVCYHDYPIIAHTYPFSIQFHHQTAGSFEPRITQFIEYSWYGILFQSDTFHVISKRRNNKQAFHEVFPGDLTVSSWLTLHSVNVSLVKDDVIFRSFLKVLDYSSQMPET